jgi:peptide/nickel transport system ATP-binding protein/oligopeptide transport system ATP-binding protein
MSAPLLTLDGLEKRFTVERGGERHALRAVHDVGLELAPGDSLGLVGESGCGKSTVARLVVRLLEPSGGRILFRGEDLTAARGPALQRLRERVQIVFQDPHASLNPRMTIFRSIAEPLVVHGRHRGDALRARVGELLDIVGLPGRFLYRYPHELSGGQKQRVCIARAVALEPDLLVLDEPTSALDVSVQAQILEFLQDLQARLGLTYLFISHDLAAVRVVCNRVAVMYLGEIVEDGPAAQVFDTPLHPYTRALIGAVPVPAAEQPAWAPLGGEVPSPLAVPPGCPFHRRCPEAMAGLCDSARPPRLRPAPVHRVACHLYAPNPMRSAAAPETT